LFSAGIKTTSCSATISSVRTGVRCFSCGSTHAISAPLASSRAILVSRSISHLTAFSPLSPGSSHIPAVGFSQRFALWRSLYLGRQLLSSAKEKGVDLDADKNAGEVDEVALDRFDSESKVDKEAIDATKQKRSPLKSPPDGEIGFVEGTIDQIRVLDVRSRGDTSSVTAASDKKKEKRKKKKSLDLMAMEKFDIIVSGEKGSDLAVGKESMRAFQLVDDDRSILEPPDEAAELRKRPELIQSDILDPTRKSKGFRIGDRAKPPEFNFSLRHALFEEAAQMEGGKTKRAFQMAIQMFNKVDPKYKRGHVEMIYQAANLMKEYDLEKDLDAYRMVFDLFPKGVLIPKGVIQAGFFHYPRQQDCALMVMCQMEQNRVMPDKEFGKQLLEIFGRRSRPHHKYRRLTYWMPKFRYASPFPLVPMNIEKEDGLTAAKRLLERICVDLENEITVFRAPRPGEEKADPLEEVSLPWIASAMSPKQNELVARLPTDKPVYVKGPFPVYLRGRKVDHFTLWAELPDHLQAHYAEDEELFEDYMRQSKDIDELMESDITRQAFRGSKRKNVLAARPSLHEQEDGIVLALSVLETFSKELLTAWIKNLETANPHLSEVPVIFSLSSAPPSELVVQQAETDSVVVNS